MTKDRLILQHLPECVNRLGKKMKFYVSQREHGIQIYYEMISPRNEIEHIGNVPLEFNNQFMGIEVNKIYGYNPKYGLIQNDLKSLICVAPFSLKEPCLRSNIDHIKDFIPKDVQLRRNHIMNRRRLGKK